MYLQRLSAETSSQYSLGGTSSEAATDACGLVAVCSVVGSCVSHVTSATPATKMASNTAVNRTGALLIVASEIECGPLMNRGDGQKSDHPRRPCRSRAAAAGARAARPARRAARRRRRGPFVPRSEEHTSELQSRENVV